MHRGRSLLPYLYRHRRRRGDRALVGTAHRGDIRVVAPNGHPHPAAGDGLGVRGVDLEPAGAGHLNLDPSLALVRHPARGIVSPAAHVASRGSRTPTERDEQVCAVLAHASPREGHGLNRGSHRRPPLGGHGATYGGARGRVGCRVCAGVPRPRLPAPDPGHRRAPRTPVGGALVPTHRGSRQRIGAAVVLAGTARGAAAAATLALIVTSRREVAP